ncbi:hypothetical protein D9611_006190 [Ephemerocybe angulata]|uniref:Cation efflux protein transmembrane domain-containing protein n=1 Tax=Ephemerocybe angulata TaxID=980116 RepID=A0A8H5C8L7_9AGAR|nr:hypothetical protein D9611_006190 [Tulosesus angulatus]
MPMPDARTRSKISLTPSKVLSPSLPKTALPRILLANVLYVLALKATKVWLLDFDAGVLWVLLRVLVCGAVGVLVWEVATGQVGKRKSIEWSALALASFLSFVQYGTLFVALYRLPSTRVILFAHFSTYWISSFTRYTSARKSLAVLAAIAISILADTHFSPEHARKFIPGYGALLLHALSSLGADSTFSVLAPSLGSTFTIATTTLGACLFAFPFYIFRSIMLNFPPSPDLPFVSLVIIPFVACSLLLVTPVISHSFDYTNLSAQVFAVSFPTLAVLTGVLGALAFSHFPSWSDLAVAGLLYYGMYPESLEQTPLAPRTPTSRLMKSYLKAILSNAESRKIFYFLMLNLAYMLVQMLYGVWTNSLGLISDAIHMAFDCMAIGVGLLASVMATWEPNGRFTYGYGRIETLSGFANGIFLILISIFIVFEAIQRILDPPEMSTNQLLLVSSVGLGVNLFGMFAMGGHHHHGGGHSHSHGHSHSLFGGGSDHAEHDHDDHGHGHSHSHSTPLPEKHTSHSHANSPAVSHSECNDHDHEHEHSHSHSPQTAHSHDHSPHNGSHSHNHSPHNDSHSHDHSHSHSEEHHGHHDEPHSHSPQDHGHSHSNGHHNHSHSEEGHSHDEDHHSHDHSHSHSPPTHARTHSHSHSPPPPSQESIAFGHSKSLSKGNALEKPLAQRRHSKAALSITVSNPTPIAVASQSPAIHVHTPSGAPAHSHDHAHDHGHSHSHSTPHQPDQKHDDHDHGHSHALSAPPPSASASGGHSHGHSHNMRGVFLHVMADTLGSVGVIISTLLIQFYGWTGFDPIASLFIAVLIAASVFPLVMDTGKILALDVSEKDREIQEALDELSSIEGLASYSCPRFWPKDASTVVGSIHIQLAPSAASSDPSGPHGSVRTTYAKVDRVIERVDTLLKQKIEGLEELTVQVEGRPGQGSGYR